MTKNTAQLTGLLYQIVSTGLNCVMNWCESIIAFLSELERAKRLAALR